MPRTLREAILYWNAFPEALYGWTSSEALGANVLDLIPASDVREAAVEIHAKLLIGESWSGEFLAKKRDVSVFPIQVTDSPIFGEAANSLDCPELQCVIQ